MTREKAKLMGKNKAIKGFILKKFKERGEKLSDFVANSDFRDQSIRLVVEGWVSSPRIRRDIARYLGYTNWMDMENEFTESMGGFEDE